MSWWEPSHAKPPAPLLHEKEPPKKPELYDHLGRPLMKQREPVGFKPPQRRKGDAR